MRFHFLANTRRSDAVASAKAGLKLLRAHQCAVAGERETALALGLDEVEGDAFAQCDLAVTFGGDGTLIRAAHLCSERGTPILGVYHGRFGFITQCTSQDLLSSLTTFLDGAATFDERMMIQTDLVRGGQIIASIHSVNEMVVQRGVTVRMPTFRVMVDGSYLTTYPADGVMISTATGSTGYNLSAGGPILDPRVHAMVLTALAPHTLSARPFVLHTDSEVDLVLESEGEAVLSADNQARLHLLSGDEIRVRKSPRVTRLMVVHRNDFLSKLGQRLFWGQSVYGGDE